MPAGRRAELLRWAGESADRYILEDDYDSEFRFDVRPLPSLQGMSGSNGRVVYLSTFSRCLTPGIRIAYMVLPRHLMPVYEQYYSSYSCTVGRMEQQTLARFMASGQFTRHLARLRSAYRKRCTTLRKSFQEHFRAGSFRTYGEHTGIHFCLQLIDGPGEKEMVRRAAEAGIRLNGLSRYSMEKSGTQLPPNTVLLGYGALKDADIPAAVERLAGAWRSGSGEK